MRIVPVSDRIVIKPNEVIKNISGIELPEEAQERPMEGEVVAVGDGNMGAFGFVPLTHKIGDRVQYSKFSGTEFTFEGNKLLIMRDGDPLFKIEKE